MEVKGFHFSSVTRREAGNSPHLNPTENAWSWMKKQLSETSTATNVVELKREVTELWVLRMSDSQYLGNRVESMPRRLEDVICREENPTKYQPVDKYTQWALFRGKIISIQR